MDRTKKAWINGIFLIATLVINSLGAFGLINGMTQKQISDKYLTLITPGPATFSIWSVIYTFLLISMIVMIAKKNDPYYQKAIDQITGLFRMSCLLNIAWIVSFSFDLVELSVLFILGFVITLAWVGAKLLHIREGKRWLLPVSFGLYSGWLFIATVVNAAAALVKLGWNGFGLTPATWAIIMLIVSVFLVIGVLLKIRNAVFPLPVAWAYLGIYQALQLGSVSDMALLPPGMGELKVVALAGMAALIVVAVVLFVVNRFSVLPAGDKIR